MLFRVYENSFDDIFNIMEKSFPITEIRTYKDQKNLLNNKLYKLYGCKNEIIYAFAAIWEFDTFIFVEHIATHFSQRGKGTGIKMIDEIKEIFKKPIVLEVEPPETEIAQRRIKFYERAGFILNNFEYMQPPLRKENPFIPLLIMTYPKKIDENEFNCYKNELYKNVYNVREDL